MQSTSYVHSHSSPFLQADNQHRPAAMYQQQSSTSVEPQTTQRKEAWTMDDFKSVQSIGNGKFGKVFRAVEINSNKTVALKLVQKSQLEKFDFFSQMKKELEI